jgi:adenylate kinase
MRDDVMRGSHKTDAPGRLVCVFGISGVGKTTLIRQFISVHSDWRALSAGELLGDLTDTAPKDLRIAERHVIEGNQFSIAEAVQRYRRVNAATKYILDAHSVIDNGREFVIVPTEVIARLGPDSLIFVFDDAALIRLRRASDRHRLRPIKSLDQIEEEQRLAFDVCLEYARELELDLCRIRSENLADFQVAVKRI